MIATHNWTEEESVVPCCHKTLIRITACSANLIDPVFRREYEFPGVFFYLFDSSDFFDFLKVLSFFRAGVVARKVFSTARRECRNKGQSSCHYNVSEKYIFGIY